MRLWFSFLLFLNSLYTFYMFNIRCCFTFPFHASWYIAYYLIMSLSMNKISLSPSSFFIFLSARMHFSTDIIYLFINTSVSSLLGSLSFSMFISFSKYSFHLSNTASELTITLLYSSFIIFTCY